jgi:hypothetical protein
LFDKSAYYSNAILYIWVPEKRRKTQDYETNDEAALSAGGISIELPLVGKCQPDNVSVPVPVSRIAQLETVEKTCFQRGRFAEVNMEAAINSVLVKQIYICTGINHYLVIQHQVNKGALIIWPLSQGVCPLRAEPQPEIKIIAIINLLCLHIPEKTLFQPEPERPGMAAVFLLKQNLLVGPQFSAKRIVECR